MTTPTFEEILRAWLLEYDDRVPSDRKERREAFIILLGNLSDHGFLKDDINNSRKEKIVKSCVNPYYSNRSKLKKWIDIVTSDFEAAFIVYYGTVKIRKDVITPEMALKLSEMEKKATETRALRTFDDGKEENNGDISDLLNSPTSIDAMVKDSVNNPLKVSQETFPITPEMLDEMEGPEVIWDEDFIKKLESGE